LNKFGLKTLTSSLKTHEMELLEDDPSRKIKYISLKSNGKIVKALQAIEYEEATPDDDTID